jgi:AGZA family xanthine/uracil permease-like MFS transporter
MEQTRIAGAGPKLWVPGDWNAFFGFGTNILVNLLVLTGLLQFVLQMPTDIIFHRILPALGLMMFLSTGYYAWLAYSYARKTGRDDVCALPSGISVPHMFVVTFVIMLPIATMTGDPIRGWEAGLVWVFFQSFILMVGGFIAPYIRRPTRAFWLSYPVGDGARPTCASWRGRTSCGRGPKPRRSRTGCGANF